MLFDLLLGDFLLVGLEVVGVHLLKRIGGRVVGLVDDGVVLLIAFDDALGRGAEHNR